jgi:predicted transcriptional regulator
MVLQILSRVLSSDYKGPRAGFSQAHVLKAILVIGEQANIGRGKLAQTLNLGQGEVRTLIKRLKETGLVKIKAHGCVLTKSGFKHFHALVKLLPWRSPVNCGLLGLGKQCFAVLVKHRSAKVNKGIEQRDAAIKSGAIGAFTVLFKKGRFVVPFGWEDCEKSGASEPWISIRAAAKPKDGDTVIISGSDDLLLSEYGALSAALSIL